MCKNLILGKQGSTQRRKTWQGVYVSEKFGNLCSRAIMNHRALSFIHRHLPHVPHKLWIVCHQNIVHRTGACLVRRHYATLVSSYVVRLTISLFAAFSRKAETMVAMLTVNAAIHFIAPYD
ncbi:hypothetical protein TNCV_1012792 [Trichonephila clavipes]|uniref:Uncharacterized protein n=1 Tax=Trichonephila clavipes TaxID=2585209 RepID=A0A8X7BAW9_TRICX|nr:hypothetical protein TNCV_1012792 [Trichonephila clavipes]